MACPAVRSAQHGAERLTERVTDMRYMNGYDIERAGLRYAGHPVLSEAVRALAGLKDWTDRNSDGWAYWAPPVRAARKLMELIEGDGTHAAELRIRAETTPAMLKAALSPVKAFRTRVTSDKPVPVFYGTYGGMPWFDITDAERAASKAKRQTAADEARAESVRELAGRLAPALHEVTCPDCDCAALYGRAADELAAKLAAIALEPARSSEQVGK